MRHGNGENNYMKLHCLTKGRKELIDKFLERVFREYGDCLRWLGKEMTPEEAKEELETPEEEIETPEEEEEEVDEEEAEE